MGKVWGPSLGTRVPTVRTPDWSRPVGFQPSTFISMSFRSLSDNGLARYTLNHEEVTLHTPK